MKSIAIINSETNEISSYVSTITEHGISTTRPWDGWPASWEEVGLFEPSDELLAKVQAALIPNRFAKWTD